MVAAGVLDECAKLLKRESTPSDVRALAGSVITLLTDLPVASTITDISSGSQARRGLCHAERPPQDVYMVEASDLRMRCKHRPSVTQSGLQCLVVLCAQVVLSNYPSKVCPHEFHWSFSPNVRGLQHGIPRGPIV